MISPCDVLPYYSIITGKTQQIMGVELIIEDTCFGAFKLRLKNIFKKKMLNKLRPFCEFAANSLIILLPNNQFCAEFQVELMVLSFYVKTSKGFRLVRSNFINASI